MVSQTIDLGLVGTKKIPLKDIRVIYSHSQPLLQGRDFLKKYCPQATLIPSKSTSAALAHVLKEDKRGVVAIASPIAAESCGLKMIHSSIQDHDGNTTYFAVVTHRKRNCNLKGAEKTSIVIAFRGNSSGSLCNILQEFTDAKINLTKIESRPSRKKNGDYVFFIDFDGVVTDSFIQKTLDKIEKKVHKLKVLGCYQVINSTSK